MGLDIDWDAVEASGFGFAGTCVLQVVMLTYCFLGLAIVCDDHMEPSLTTLCTRWSVPADVAGATFMAFGSAAPEIIINVVATLQAQMSGAGPGEGGGDQTNLGVSAILGSGMIAFSFIPATCAFAADKELHLARRPLFRDEFFYLLALVTLIYIIWDGTVHYWEAALLVSTYVVYLFVIVLSGPIRETYRVKFLGKIPKAERRKAKAEKDATLKEPLVAGDEVLDFDDTMTSKSHYDEDEDEEPKTCLGKTIAFLAKPLNFAFWLTCPDAEIGSKTEYLYGVTFLASFVWISVFSFVLSSIIERWVDLSGVNMAVFGLLMVSGGAEIPDTIASVTVAKQGYGSMAVANCQGTQVINIAIGLGLSWLMACTASPIVLSPDLIIPALLMLGVLMTNMFLLLGTTMLAGRNKAILGRAQGTMLYLTYVAAIVAFIAIMWARGALSPPAAVA